MLGRRARHELKMQVTISKVEELNEEKRFQFAIPPFIGGTMTKVSLNNSRRNLMYSRKVVHIIDGSPCELLETESEMTGGPRNSHEYSPSFTLTEISGDASSSDYVSTLNDPAEDCSE